MIYSLRDQRVILDSDLAAIYGVQPGRQAQSGSLSAGLHVSTHGRRIRRSPPFKITNCDLKARPRPASQAPHLRLPPQGAAVRHACLAVLSRQSSERSASEPTLYELKNVSVGEAGRRLGFSPKDMIHGTNNPPDQDIRLVVVRDYELAVVSDRQPTGNAQTVLDNTNAPCTVEARLIPQLRRGTNK